MRDKAPKTRVLGIRGNIGFKVKDQTSLALGIDEMSSHPKSPFGLARQLD